MVPSENASNLMDYKEFKRISVTRSRSLIEIEYVSTKQPFFGHVMRRRN